MYRLPYVLFNRIFRLGGFVMENMLEIGQVVNTHGVRGELKIMPWCDDPAIYDELEYFYIDGRRYDIKRTRFHKNCGIVAVEGIDNINDAELLKNKIVTVEREALGELPEGTYYIADLLELEVKTVEGKVLGRIFDVISTGSNDVYHIKAEGKKDVLIPVIDEVVKEVNIEDGYVTVALMKGLVDDEV